MSQVPRIILRRLSNTETLRLALPREITSELRLSPGDHAVPEIENGRLVLKFFRIAELEQLAEQSAAA